MLMIDAEPSLALAPCTLAAWACCFDPADIPVLATTAAALDELRLQEDAVDAQILAETIRLDPLMTLRLLAHVGALRRGRDGGDAETALEALVMLGIPPFFRAFAKLETVEQCLSGRFEAMAGFRRVLERAHRAANFATAFAVHRMDHDVAVIHEAALLHGFAEMLLWLKAPALAQEIRRRQLADPQLRSADVQRAVLNIALPDLQHELMTAWRLPALLVQITDVHRCAGPQLRNVLLAIRVARHSADGWDNPAIPDDVQEIAGLLNMGAEPTLRLLREIDGD